MCRRAKTCCLQAPATAETARGLSYCTDTRQNQPNPYSRMYMNLGHGRSCRLHQSATMYRKREIHDLPLKTRLRNLKGLVRVSEM